MYKLPSTLKAVIEATSGCLPFPSPLPTPALIPPPFQQACASTFLT